MAAVESAVCVVVAGADAVGEILVGRRNRMTSSTHCEGERRPLSFPHLSFIRRVVVPALIRPEHRSPAFVGADGLERRARRRGSPGLDGRGTERARPVRPPAPNPARWPWVTAGEGPDPRRRAPEPAATSKPARRSVPRRPSRSSAGGRDHRLASYAHRQCAGTHEQQAGDGTPHDATPHRSGYVSNGLCGLLGSSPTTNRSPDTGRDDATASGL